MEQRPENYSRETSTDKTSSGKSSVALIVVLSTVAVALGIILGIVTHNKSNLIEELQIEKTELQNEFTALQQDYAGISSDYENINAQLDSSRAEIDQLVARLQETDATNRAQIRRYQKELGTLRAIMRNYIVQIDSLNTLNHKLTEDAAAARKETATVRKQNQALQEQVEDLSGKVETGSVLHVSNVKAEAYNKNGKVVDRAKATVRVLMTLVLAQNSLAARGPMRVYIIVKDPSGNILTNDESRVCNFVDGPVQTSASREVDYQGNEVELSIYLNNVPQYVKGIYTVQVMTEKTVLGNTQFMLR